MACGQRTTGCRLRHRQLFGGELPRDQPAPLLRSPQQGYFCARLLVHGDPGPVVAQVLFVDHQGHGCYWQVPWGCLTRRAIVSRSPTCTSTTSAQSEGPSALPCCFSSAMCMKLGAVILTGDFKSTESDAAPSGPSDQRRISPLQAAFSNTNIPWPSSGVAPLWGPGGELHGGTWPDC